MEQVYLKNSVFLNNQGIPIYISYQNVFVSGIIILGNEASRGGGIFIANQSSIVIQNSDIKFINNEAFYDGGALYMQNSNIVLDCNSTVSVTGNQARLGGAFCIRDNCDVTFEGNSTVTINNNRATGVGGAFYIRHNLMLHLKETLQ